MRINIYYLNKCLIASDEENTGQDYKVYEVNTGTKFSEINKFIDAWLCDPTSHVYLKFDTIHTFFSFLMIYLQEHFRVIYAAGGLVRNEHKAYLFIYKKNYWDLPKGKVDENEKAEEAAIRECTEETGIKDLKIVKNLGVTYHVFYQKKEWVLKITQWFLMYTKDSGLLQAQTEEGIEKAEWMSREDICEKVLTNTYLSIREVLERGCILCT